MPVGTSIIDAHAGGLGEWQLLLAGVLQTQEARGLSLNNKIKFNKIPCFKYMYYSN